MAAGTITISVTETGQTTLTKTYNIADVSVITAAYQAMANDAVKGTATRAQVMNFLAGTYATSTQEVVQLFQTVPASFAPPIAMT